MIDSYNNLENAIEIRIFQELLASPILFLIYISEAFQEEKKKLSALISLSFINYLGFIILKMTI